MHCSAVIPVFNEEDSLTRLHDELRQVSREHSLRLEIWFVDDGSTDKSWQVIRQLAERDADTHLLRFRRNFGKSAALSAGFDEAQGDVVFTLDADLQDNPKEIPRFLAMLGEGYDVISGWKVVRHDPWHKTLPSRVFNKLVGVLTGVKLHDHNCGFKCYRREVLEEVDLYGEMHRFIPVLAAARGFRVGEMGVEHRARAFGESKYGFERFVKGFLDLLTVYFLTGFRQRPQHLLGTIGLVAFALGSIGMTYLAGYWVVRQFTDWGETLIPLHQRPLTLYSLGALLLGAQLISLGFLAELITANQRRRVNVRGPTDYSIKERIDVRVATPHGTPDTHTGRDAPNPAENSTVAQSPRFDTENVTATNVVSGEIDLNAPELQDPSGLHGKGTDV